MLFSTYTFLFFFLPITLVGYYALGKVHWRASIAWLTLSSFVYYGWWNPDPSHPWSPQYVFLVLFSCLANFLLGNRIADSKSPNTRKLIINAGVSANLALLVYYKYLGLFAGWTNLLFGAPTSVPAIVLPLAVSFFTFLQIAFLVDVYRGDKTGYSFLDYLLFVTFFPHLVAGPLVHHRELIRQFKPAATQFSSRRFSIGLTILVIGLFKKVVLADTLAGTATPIFDFAAEGARALTTGEAWAGALAYTFQLYFDFSGYSDMAIGLSYLFGLKLPLNFNSPYKSASIVEFWRAWHMTLSRFLRDYLYIPLGGNRKGPSRRYVNLIITMLLGGLWHGAGITFALWGLLHGLYLCINHAWQNTRKRVGLPAIPKPIAILITFIAVTTAWVPFRAGNYELGLQGSASQAWQTTMTFYEAMFFPDFENFWTPESGAALMKAKSAYRPVLQMLIIVFLLPNTQQFMGRYSPHLDIYEATNNRRRKWWQWSPKLIFAALTFLLFVAVTWRMGQGSEFIYFQF